MRYSPWDHLESLPHLTFGVARLPHGKGWWLPEMEAIVLDSRLSRVERRTVLSHELAHAEANDSNCHYQGPDGARQARRQEIRADLVAARRCIEVDDLVSALQAHPLDPEAVADFLDVTPDLLRVRLQALTPTQKQDIECRLSDLGEMTFP